MDEVVNQKLDYYFKPEKQLKIASVVKEGHLYVDFDRTKKSLRYLDSQAFILNYLRERGSNSLGFSYKILVIDFLSKIRRSLI